MVEATGKAHDMSGKGNELDVSVVENALNGAAASVETLVGQLSSHAQEATAQVVGDLVDTMDGLRRQAADLAGKATHEVQEHPVIALASAVAAVAAVAGLIALASSNSKPATAPVNIPS